jgi:hypothetical protein
VLSRVAITKPENLYHISSDADGLALKKLQQPLKGVATFTLNITPGTGSPSNGFFVFGKGSSNEVTTKCGLLVGGNRITIYHGAYGKPGPSAPVSLVGGKTYSVSVTINVPDRKVSMKVAGKILNHTLPPEMDQVGHIGYGIVRTTGSFGEIISKE